MKEIVSRNSLRVVWRKTDTVPTRFLVFITSVNADIESGWKKYIISVSFGGVGESRKSWVKRKGGCKYVEKR